MMTCALHYGLNDFFLREFKGTNWPRENDRLKNYFLEAALLPVGSKNGANLHVVEALLGQFEHLNMPEDDDCFSPDHGILGCSPWQKYLSYLAACPGATTVRRIGR